MGETPSINESAEEQTTAVDAATARKYAAFGLMAGFSGLLVAGAGVLGFGSEVTTATGAAMYAGGAVTAALAEHVGDHGRESISVESAAAAASGLVTAGVVLGYALAGAL